MDFVCEVNIVVSMSQIHNGIQYVGLPGATQDCLNGIMRLIQFGDEIKLARIVSVANEHGLLLTIGPGDLVAIKSGFATGYGGEGPHKFSYALQLLCAHDVEIDEFIVDRSFLDRLDYGALTIGDIENLDTMRPVRPSRYHDYIDTWHNEMHDNGSLWKKFSPVVPLGIIDSRITDLAITFWQNPNDKIMVGYKRLEDIVRERVNSKQFGVKLFSEAFLGKDSKLQWDDTDDGERIGRASLFTATYSAHRNPRAHKEKQESRSGLLSEFLLLNHLFILEKEAVSTDTVPAA
jgi:Protein of unknown function (Hypoth_ymh)